MKKILIAAVFLIALISTAFYVMQKNNSTKHFIKTKGKQFILQDKPFSALGTNNYYILYKSRNMVDRFFDTAAANNITIVRTWGFLDVGKKEGSNSPDGAKEGIYFQYWDGKKPVIHEGETGLKKLDYIVYKAKEKNIRLIIPFTDNWKEFGGMDQYVAWRGGKAHHEFYTDATIKQWYKKYVSHILNRKNTYTGVIYKEDPTIMAWELANEPRCSNNDDTPEVCTSQTITTWAKEMSEFIKSIDKYHLVGTGSEGFYCDGNEDDWIENCSQGVDTKALSALKTIDYTSVHVYPDKWGKTPEWATDWIKKHQNESTKPLLIGEFGLQDKTKRTAAYTAWLNALPEHNTLALIWMLADKDDNGQQYKDYDGYTIYCPGEVCTLLRQRALSF